MHRNQINDTTIHVLSVATCAPGDCLHKKVYKSIGHSYLFIFQIRLSKMLIYIYELYNVPFSRLAAYEKQ